MTAQSRTISRLHRALFVWNSAAAISSDCDRPAHLPRNHPLGKILRGGGPRRPSLIHPNPLLKPILLKWTAGGDGNIDAGERAAGSEKGGRGVPAEHSIAALPSQHPRTARRDRARLPLFARPMGSALRCRPRPAACGFRNRQAPFCLISKRGESSLLESTPVEAPRI